jgi:hypothetical protein
MPAHDDIRQRLGLSLPTIADCDALILMEWLTNHHAMNEDIEDALDRRLTLMRMRDV